MFYADTKQKLLFLWNITRSNQILYSGRNMGILRLNVRITLCILYLIKVVLSQGKISFLFNFISPTTSQNVDRNAFTNLIYRRRNVMFSYPLILFFFLLTLLLNYTNLKEYIFSNWISLGKLLGRSK